MTPAMVLILAARGLNWHYNKYKKIVEHSALRFFCRENTIKIEERNVRKVSSQRYLNVLQTEIQAAVKIALTKAFLQNLMYIKESKVLLL